jgi:hypothetical protein
VLRSFLSIGVPAKPKRQAFGSSEIRGHVAVLAPVLVDEHEVVPMNEDVRRLPREELLEVLATPHPDELFIGGLVDANDGVVTLYRGNLEPLVVPLKWFKVSGNGVRPDPARLDVTDFGHTVRFGEYEVSTHAILYNHDGNYRRWAQRDFSNRTTRSEERSDACGF